MKTDDRMIDLLQIKSFEIIKQFKSRQNQVCLINARNEQGREYYVYKQHSSDHAEKEKITLKELYSKGVKVPKVLHSNKTAILMEYLDGDTLIERIEFLEQMNYSGKKEITEVVRFLKEFYEALGDRIHWDINFSNFVFHEDNLWGVDFEDVTQGEKETDMGRFIAFLMTYAPAFTKWKLHFLREFYPMAKEYLKIDKHKVRIAMMDEFLRIQQRRQIKLLDADIQKIVF